MKDCQWENINRVMLIEFPLVEYKIEVDCKDVFLIIKAECDVVFMDLWLRLKKRLPMVFIERDMDSDGSPEEEPIDE